ncbi:uncharacterized protein METZ01_LOCUS171771 [marine metagenome]|uniref:Cytochrome c oxidase assembly protein n=1 Tax=marine metagenome TaxID=408172 RepID=A0A382C0F8_9ZZZZ
MESSIYQIIWNHWHPHPEVIIGLILVQLTYMFWVGKHNRNVVGGEISIGQIMAFTLGIIIIAICLLSPLHYISDNYLFSAHMLQHVLLTLLAPPLIIFGIPDQAINKSLEIPFLSNMMRFLTHPLVAFISFNLTFSIWHMPQLYHYSVSLHWVHVVEHSMFIFTAILMWWPIASRSRLLPKLNYPLRIIYLFFLSIAQIIVFGMITFSNDPLYDWYINAPRLFGISAMLDQQIGGIIMKVGGGGVFLTLLITIFLKWYKNEQNTPGDYTVSEKDVFQ